MKQKKQRQSQYVKMQWCAFRRGDDSDRQKTSALFQRILERRNEEKMRGCDYVKWLPVEPETLEEKCPKCSAQLVLTVTRFGKKMKKCTTGGWDSAAKKRLDATMSNGSMARPNLLQKTVRNAAKSSCSILLHQARR